MDELIKVIRKIANYVHNQSEGLTEDEFKLLDQASGLELAELSYKNRINFNRVLKNADQMIDLYNEQLIHAQINEVKALKRCLQNPTPLIIAKKTSVKKSAKPPQKQQTVIPDNIIPNTNIPVPNIEISEAPAGEVDVNLPLSLTIPPQSFTSALLAESDPSHVSIPMQRDAVRPTGHLSLIRSNVNISKSAPNALENVQPDEVPVLDESDLARLGFFDGEQGRKMTRILHQQQEITIGMRPSVENQILPLHEEIQPEQAELPPAAANYDAIEKELDLLHLEAPNEAQQSIPAPEIHIREEQLQLDHQNFEVTQTVPNESTRELMTQRFESFINAVDAANEMLGRAKRRVRRPQRAQRPARKSTDNEFSLLNLRKEVLHKIKRHQRVRPINPLRCRQAPTTASDLFGDIQISINNDLPFEDEEQQPIVPVSDFGATTTHHRILTSTPMNPGHQKKRVNLSPENDQQITKRVRTSQVEVQAEIHAVPQEPVSNSELTVPNLPASIIESSLVLQSIPEFPEVVVNRNQEMAEITGPQSFQPSMDIPQLPPDISDQLDIPRHASHDIQSKSANNDTLNVPQVSTDRPVPSSILSSKDLPPVQERRKQRQALLDNLRISADSIDYDRLRVNSRLRKGLADPRVQIPPDEIFQNACENISEQEATRTRKSRVMNSHAPKTSSDLAVPDDVDNFEGFKRVMINKELHIELVSNDGNKKLYYTDHQFGCVLLYLKIRSLMSRERGSNPWRMDIKELFEHLKDFNEAKFVIYQRILHMTHLRILIGTFSDDNKLLEVEIPVVRTEGSVEKENFQSRERRVRRN